MLVFLIVVGYFGGDLALSGAMHFKITKEQLEQLAHGVKRLHEVTEKLCKEKIESFG